MSNQFYGGFHCEQHTQNQFVDFTKRRALVISIMERGELEDMVSDKISTAISSSQNQLLTEMTKLISTEVKKISDTQFFLSELQMKKKKNASMASLGENS